MQFDWIDVANKLISTYATSHARKFDFFQSISFSHWKDISHFLRLLLSTKLLYEIDIIIFIALYTNDFTLESPHWIETNLLTEMVCQNHRNVSPDIVFVIFIFVVAHCTKSYPIFWLLSKNNTNIPILLLLSKWSFARNTTSNLFLCVPSRSQRTYWFELVYKCEQVNTHLLSIEHK